MRASPVLAVALAIAAFGCARTVPESALYSYKRPLSSPGAKLGGLPPAVQQTIRAQTGSAQIRDIDKLEHTGRTAYRVMYDDELRFPPLYVAPDGSVLYPDFSVAVGAGEDDFGVMTGGAARGIPIGDLPVNVLKAIQREAPTAEIDVVNRITSGESTYYEVTFKGRDPRSRLLLSESGAVLQEPKPK
ncbi:MAG TPA: hypothetical protein GYA07_02630 [Verrucomicrobia bacterium]|nr:hypothetical protein [Verrucomicrobiota bacterium]HOB32557.1 hypothetical protein [Verrucomicrobiota bacterium]HOP98479.1 hypothetical protein [Verrucomicrobiota bacterium]HPU56580.1 hypothetical protein [Verrucomicrobiota bacterium]